MKAATKTPAASAKAPEISIHAAREGGDQSPFSLLRYYLFQSTPPVKAATCNRHKCRVHSSISIHAAREGGDAVAFFAAEILSISIHAAREGGDDNTDQNTKENKGFQSTPPVKAATKKSPFFCRFQLFQSTPPVKAATTALNTSSGGLSISIHAAREGGDNQRHRHRGFLRAISIHAAREGGDAV